MGIENMYEESKTQNFNGDTPAKARGLSGSTLKWIAIISMLIDHTGSAIVGRLINQGISAVMALPGVEAGSAFLVWKESHEMLYLLYNVMRGIGRIAFPIYCFLLVEGFHKTHDVRKYLLRLLAFALISEIPFDFAFESTMLEFSYQNVFFTLFLGLLTISCMDFIKNNIKIKPVMFISAFLAAAAGAVLAQFLHTDYGATGVAMIVVLSLFYGNQKRLAVAGAVAFCWEIPAPLAFIFVGLYNGERGAGLKYFFYAFYPLHLLLLYLISVLMGIGAYKAF